MLLDDDVMSNGQAEAGALSGGFSREEGIEHFLLHLGWDAGAVVAYPDLYPVPQVFRSRYQLRLEVIIRRLYLTFSRRIEPV